MCRNLDKAFLTYPGISILTCCEEGVSDLWVAVEVCTLESCTAAAHITEDSNARICCCFLAAWFLVPRWCFFLLSDSLVVSVVGRFAAVFCSGPVFVSVAASCVLCYFVIFPLIVGSW